jgi:hypothetical protein
MQQGSLCRARSEFFALAAKNFDRDTSSFNTFLPRAVKVPRRPDNSETFANVGKIESHPGRARLCLFMRMTMSFESQLPGPVLPV